METVRWIAVGVLILFSIYTVYASRTESFGRSFKTVMSLKWGRQVVIDLSSEPFPFVATNRLG
jgi:hypothetical protein